MKKFSKLSLKDMLILGLAVLAIIISILFTVIVASRIVSTDAQAETLKFEQQKFQNNIRKVVAVNLASEITTKQAASVKATVLKNAQKAESKNVGSLLKVKTQNIKDENLPNDACTSTSFEVFIATAYCPCKQCSGGYGNGTSTGTVATAGRTIAVDPSVIPYGSEVIINGHTYVAEDCGGAIKGNRIDIFFNTHEEAEQFGRQKVSVEIKKIKPAK